MDRRLTPFSRRKALNSLQGQVDAQFTQGEEASLGPALAFLRASPGGKVDRQLIHGAELLVIERRDGHAFIQAQRDGYCGWLRESDLALPFSATHRISSPATHRYPQAKVQSEPPYPLWMNSRIAVIEDDGTWARTPYGFIPSRHLAPLEEPAADPVSVAESLLHAPYLWGGNSAAGIDCSGLVQLAFHACGHDMPGDSDLQAEVGSAIPAEAPLRRGDLLFWKGHVAIVAEPHRILHANGHSMNVAHEPLEAAIRRIAAQGGGPVTARRRI